MVQYTGGNVRFTGYETPLIFYWMFMTQEVALRCAGTFKTVSIALILNETACHFPLMVALMTL